MQGGGICTTPNQIVCLNNIFFKKTNLNDEVEQMKRAQVQWGRVLMFALQ